MKKGLLVFGILGFCVKIVAQQIPDPNFAQAIRLHCPACIDSSNRLTAAARVQTHLTVSMQNIDDLTGIAGFSMLNSLNCTNNRLRTLPNDLPPTLQLLKVEYNQITYLPTLPTGLKELDCSNNFLSSLPVLPVGLINLDCSHNLFTSLPNPLPIDLEGLFCYNNLLTALPVLPKKLKGLACSYNFLKKLPELPNTLTLLSCEYNRELRCLPLLPETMQYLFVSNHIVCLPNIVKDMHTERLDSVVATIVNLPFCNDLLSPPCDTFPRKQAGNTIVLIEKTPKINNFPNPTEGGAFVVCENCYTAEINIFDAYGRLCKRVQDTEINLSALAAGVYYVVVETADGIFLKEKLVKL